MVFNDPENKQGIIQHIDFLLFGNSDKFHDAYSLPDRVRNCNLAYDDLVTLLFKADPNWSWDDDNYTELPIALIDVNSGQDHYSVKDSFIVINQVRVKDRNGNWMDIDSDLRRNIDDLESTGTPERYYKIGRSIFLHPVPDYAAEEGLEVQFQRKGEYFESTDTDKEPGFSSIFHDYIPASAALEWASTNGMKDKITTLGAKIEKMENKIETHYEKRSPDERPQLSLKRRNIKHTGL